MHVVTGRDAQREVTITVNGEATAVSADGSFEARLQVTSYGPLEVMVTARDPLGRETTLSPGRVEYRRLLYRELARNDKGMREFERLTDGMVMVEIPGASFTRGSGGALPDAPAARVDVSSFLIAKYCVTNAQYAKFLTARGTDVATASASQR